jgi:class 3 adenylate cyclase
MNAPHRWPPPFKSSTTRKAGQAHSNIHIKPEQIDPASPQDGERKTVTALFADIKGSTELMAELDPEEARSIIDPALKLMIEAARRYDGYVVQSTADWIFALFGAPVAHEDHPQKSALQGAPIAGTVQPVFQSITQPRMLALTGAVRP